MHHDDRPVLRVEVGERHVQDLAVDDRRRDVADLGASIGVNSTSIARWRRRRTISMQALTTSRRSHASNQFRVAQTAQVAPRAEEPFLDRARARARNLAGSIGPLRPAWPRTREPAAQRRHDRPAAPVRRGLAGPRQPQVTAGPSGRARSVWRWRGVNRSRAWLRSPVYSTRSGTRRRRRSAAGRSVQGATRCQVG